MAKVLSGAIGWLVEFVREVDRGIAVGYGYEPSDDGGRSRCGGFQTRWTVGCRHRAKTGKEVRDHR